MKIPIVLICLVAGLHLHAPAQEKATVEKFAEFPGGTIRFFEFIRNELRYPADALKDSITGDVHVTFIVAATGEIMPESIRILKGVSPSCDEEALRVIRKAPAWTPGRVKEVGASKAVESPQQITFPVSFRLE